MDRSDQIRLGDAQHIVTSLEVVGMSGELGAAKRLFVELVRLDHGAHRAVEDH